MPLYRVTFSITDRGDVPSSLELYINQPTSADAADRAQALAEIISPAAGTTANSMILGTIQSASVAEVLDISTWAIRTGSPLTNAEAGHGMEFVWRSGGLYKTRFTLPTFNQAVYSTDDDKLNQTVSPVTGFNTEIITNAWADYRGDDIGSFIEAVETNNGKRNRRKKA